MTDITPTNLYLALGRIHPLIVHFPVAMLLAAAVVELVRGKRKNLSPSNYALAGLWVGCPSAIVAAWFGWINAETQDFEGALSSTLFLHRWLGIGVACASLLCVVAGWLAQRGPSRAIFIGYLTLLMVSALGVGVTAHFGGVMVHGSGYIHEVLFAKPTSDLDVPIEALHAALPLQESGEHKVSFAKDIHPLLDEKCFKCHAGGKSKGGLRMDSRDSLLSGGKTGPAVVVGASSQSLLLKLVRGLEPDRVMPKKGARLTDAQLSLIAAWIDQGLTWDDKLKPEIPKASKADYRIATIDVPPTPQDLSNPIDRLLHAYFERRAESGTQATKRLAPSELAEDRVFIRRTYLDLIGLLPTPHEVTSFQADSRTDKREVLIGHLLQRNEDYAQHWLSFWNDNLRNDYEGTGYVDGGRRQITEWLYTSLLKNTPYDQLAQTLVKGATPSTEGFVKGIVWRGTINANEKPEIQAAQNIGQVFMGVNLKCASCHDSFIDQWTLKDSYGLANVYAAEPLEIFRCEEKTGKTAAPAFLYPELGDIAADLAPMQKRDVLAHVLTDPKNGRFARTIVNRLWARLMGRGLVEPVDELDQPPWDKDLLDWLANDFVSNGYNLRHTLQQIATSRAYQLRSAPRSEAATKEFVFAGPHVKRMTAEQFLDALYTVTDSAPHGSAEDVRRVVASDMKGDSHVVWRHIIEPGEHSAQVEVNVNLENAKVLWLVTKPVAVSLDSLGSTKVEQTSSEPIETKKSDDTKKRAYRYLLRDPVLRNATEELSLGALRPTYSVDSRVVNAAEGTGVSLGAFSVVTFPLPDGGTTHLHATLLVEKAPREPSEFAILADVPIRASLFASSELLRAVGRPARDQVITARSTVARTMEALALTQNPDLHALIRRGREQMMHGAESQEGDTISHLFWKALGREPNGNELATIDHLRRSEGRTGLLEGGALEDLLWSITMLPEFQLVL